MNTVTRTAKDLSAHDRMAFEHVLGTTLAEDDEIVVQVRPPVKTPTGASAPKFPEWLHVYKGLSEQEIADLERSILDRGPSRT